MVEAERLFGCIPEQPLWQEPRGVSDSINQERCFGWIK